MGKANKQKREAEKGRQMKSLKKRRSNGKQSRRLQRMRLLCKSIFNIGIYRWMATVAHVRAIAMTCEKSTVIHGFTYVIIVKNSFRYHFIYLFFFFTSFFRSSHILSRVKILAKCSSDVYSVVWITIKLCVYFYNSSFILLKFWDSFSLCQYMQKMKISIWNGRIMLNAFQGRQSNTITA